jgi:hypothetical protein
MQFHIRNSITDNLPDCSNERMHRGPVPYCPWPEFLHFQAKSLFPSAPIVAKESPGSEKLRVSVENGVRLRPVFSCTSPEVPSFLTSLCSPPQHSSSGSTRGCSQSVGQQRCSVELRIPRPPSKGRNAKPQRRLAYCRLCSSGLRFELTHFIFIYIMARAT